MTRNIVTHQQPNIKRLRANRAQLMTELRDLEGLPEHQLRRRYYEIQPLLKSVCRELSMALTAEGAERVTQKSNYTEVKPNDYDNFQRILSRQVAKGR